MGVHILSQRAIILSKAFFQFGGNILLLYILNDNDTVHFSFLQVKNKLYDWVTIMRLFLGLLAWLQTATVNKILLEKNCYCDKIDTVCTTATVPNCFYDKIAIITNLLF
jgi:hypothetical protein